MDELEIIKKEGIICLSDLKDIIPKSERNIRKQLSSLVVFGFVNSEDFISRDGKRRVYFEKWSYKNK